jgi:fructokinase
MGHGALRNRHTRADPRGAGQHAMYTRNSRFRADSRGNGSVVDTVGAGDAYAAVVAAGLVRKGLPIRTPLSEWAAEFAAHICGLPGADSR